jgi:hypothetical protein
VNQGDVIWDDSDEDSPKDIVDESIQEQAAGVDDVKEGGDSKSVIVPSADTEQKNDAEESDLQSVQNADISHQRAEVDPPEDNTVSVEQDVKSQNQENQPAVAQEDSKENTEKPAVAQEDSKENTEISLDEKNEAPCNVPVKDSVEDSFDIIRKESLALEIQDKDQNLTSDDDWGGWDDSPDSPTVK